MLLYNKYRSTRFDEVIGQEHITDSLKGLIKTGNYKDLNSIIFACNKEQMTESLAVSATIANNSRVSYIQTTSKLTEQATTKSKT